jgi:signal transduction histidine kinase
MPNGEKLTINATCENGKAQISVEDTGQGISPEAKSKLFTPLVTSKAKRQGFGLVVVKRLTEALDGTVTYESEMGKRTKFIIELLI